MDESSDATFGASEEIAVALPSAGELEEHDFSSLVLASVLSLIGPLGTISTFLFLRIPMPMLFGMVDGSLMFLHSNCCLLLFQDIWFF